MLHYIQENTSLFFKTQKQKFLIVLMHRLQEKVLSYLTKGKCCVFKAFNFRKKMRKITSDNEKFMKRTSDKKWCIYKNIYKIAQYYNQTKNQ